MPPGKPLTDKMVKSIKPPAKRLDYFDSRSPGLVLRVTPNGHKSWAYRYFLSKPRRLTIGTYPGVTLAGARAKAEQYRQIRERGDDPHEVVAREKTQHREDRKLTVDAVIEEFIEKHARKKNKTWVKTKNNLTRYVLPRFKGRPLSSITRRELINLIDRLAEQNGAATAIYVRANVRKMFRWAAGRDMIAHNPSAELEKPKANPSRERVLTDAEVKAIWSIATTMGYPFGDWLRLLFLTGQRKDRVARLQWDHVDPEWVWRLPKELTKSGREELTPLLPEAVEILTLAPRAGRYVFTTARSSIPICPGSKVKDAIDLASDTEDWRFHDIRRTVATNMGNLGIDRFIIKKVLNHADESVTGIYDRAQYIKEKREALEKWAVRLRQIVA